MSVDLRIYFNFRSPYCYLASKTMFALLDDYDVNLLWRPLGEWDGRSPPDRAKAKIPLTRQDVARWAKRMAIPFNPPPLTTDPTLAGIGSLLAERNGCLRNYVVETMQSEWGLGLDIGQRHILITVAERVGLERGEFESTLDDPAQRKELSKNWEEAQSLGVIGVPSFVINDQIFWGNDRLDFVREYLAELRLARI